MKTFIFESYEFNPESAEAAFRYSFDDGHTFTEVVTFTHSAHYSQAVLDRALFLAWILIGTSYYKCFPVTDIQFKHKVIDQWQAEFLNRVYQEGLSQFAFENQLKREHLAQFVASTTEHTPALPYAGEGILALQSGGKDSLLMAQVLNEVEQPFTAVYISSSTHAPDVLEHVGEALQVTTRRIDIAAIKQAQQDGGLNGHVPVTFIVLSLGLIQAILNNDKTVIASIGHEGEEPHAWIDDLPVNHQWSKTWPAEQLFAEYVSRYVSSDIQVGSPLRGFSEFRISQLFVEKAWSRYGHNFSSCNRANYQQGADNTHLSWCGDCPKCANAFLLFAPFVEHQELIEVFNGKDLFMSPNLTQTFKGLLGIDGVMKPFECIGEIDELRYAYQLSAEKGYARLPFHVPTSSFDPSTSYPLQEWARVLTASAL